MHVALFGFSGDWQPFARTAPEAAALHMACPYAAAYNMTHALLPSLLRASRGLGGAHVLNVTSAAAFTAWRGAASYGAARWAVRWVT
jgi:NAD(P)-dependent dehydrogenase (short-subunit alcohol dehydrogenase family)